MKFGIKKALTKQHKQRIEAELAEIEAQEAQTQLGPLEQLDDTFMVVNLKAKREQLLQELASCNTILQPTQPVYS